LGIHVMSFYTHNGASVRSSAEVVEGTDDDFQSDDGLLEPGPDYDPPRLKGVSVSRHNPTNFRYIVDNGENIADGTVEDYSRFVDYFKAAVVLKEERFWVNLSAYESDRMIPEALAGTQMGRDMLADDVTLKRLTASLMHPESVTGSRFWGEVLDRVRRRYGSTNLRIDSFQKVWIVPKKVVVYSMPQDIEPDSDVLTRFHVERGDYLAYIVESEMDTLCEADFLAYTNNRCGATRLVPNSPNQVALDVFREVVLPEIRHQVNRSSHFAKIRQILNALALATWFKKELRNVPEFTAIFEHVDSDRPNSLITTNLSVRPLNGDRSEERFYEMPKSGTATAMRIDHLDPDAKAFQIAENVEFYRQYIKLFRDGVFRYSKAEVGDSGGIIHRQYVSGALRLGIPGAAWCMTSDTKALFD